MTKVLIKIDGIPSDYDAMPFGRQIEYRHVIAAFKDSAQSIHVRAKGKSTNKAFSEFKKLYKPQQWYAVNRDSSMYHDDSFEVWFK